MKGIKVAALIVGGTFLMLAAVFAMVYGFWTWLGPTWGAVASIGTVFALMFAFIAYMENRWSQ